MTVLKRDSDPAARVLRFATMPAAAITPADTHIEELNTLRHEAAAHQRDLRAALADIEMACADARAQGKAEGYAQSESREAERVAALHDGVAQALASFDERLTGERDLAVDIAQAALAAMIGDAIPYRDLVAATAAHHATTLAQGSIVRLTVSAADFPDDVALAALHRLDRRIAVVADPALAAGACRFDLTLGALDAAITTQATAAAALLDEARR